jgi:F-type H+-transporting ATPase subunit epsilon
VANTMQVELVSPEKIVFSGEATQVITRTLGGGEIAFLPGHAPFLGALAESHTRITLADGTQLDAAVHGGFVQVNANKVSILSDLAELAEEIDRGRAIGAMERAEATLRNAHDAEAEAALSRAHVRLNATGGVSGTAAGAH